MLAVAVIVLILALLLASPVSVSASFEQELTVTARYLFLRFRLLPQKEKKPARKKKEEKPEAEKPQEPASKKSFRDILKKRGVSGLLELLSEAASLAGSVLRRFFSHVRVSQFDLFLAVATEDAAETALLYGRACAAAYPAVSALMQACGCRRFGVSVVPDFQRSKSEVRFRMRARISLFYILREGLSALLRAAELWQKFQSGPGGARQAEQPPGAKST